MNPARNAKVNGGQRWNRTTDTGIFNPLCYRPVLITWNCIIGIRVPCDISRPQCTDCGLATRNTVLRVSLRCRVRKAGARLGEAGHLQFGRVNLPIFKNPNCAHEIKPNQRSASAWGRRVLDRPSILAGRLCNSGLCTRGLKINQRCGGSGEYRGGVAKFVTI